MRSLKTVLLGIFLSGSLLIPSYEVLAQTNGHVHAAATDQQAQQTPADRPWLGITVRDIAPETAKTLKLADNRGVMVSNVMDSGPADKAGIDPGDVILKLNGADVRDTEDFINRVQRQKVGDSVTLQASRGGALKSFTVELGVMPQMTGMMGGASMGMMACAECPMMMGGSMAGQDCPMHGGAKMGMMGGGKMGGMMDGDHMMTEGRHFDKIYMMAVKQLNLNADQKKKADALKTDFQKKAIKAKADIKIAEVELKEMLAAEPVNLDKVKQKVSDIYAKKAEKKMLWIRTVEDFKKVLTPEQKEKFREIISGGGPGCPQICPMTGGQSGGSDDSEEASGRE